ncbi:tyrosine-type recombinase/integrase [Novosphingobium sp.]|uniref:tyrosine-type recombinase/integrase n=1 Tax=Novosphingobium sp. TaxID=1874826 RepID=UPI003D11EDA5
MAPRKEKLPKNVSAWIDRHGKRRYRWRKGGRTVYLNAHPNTPEGRKELDALVAGVAATKHDRHVHGTVAWAASRFFVSTTFTGGKSPSTQRTSRLILEKFVAEFATQRIIDWRFDHIEAVLATAATKRQNDKGRWIGGPSAAMNLRGELLPFFDYAFKLLSITKQSPVAQAGSITVPKGGFHTWTDLEIAQFRKHWKVGTKARLALEIFLWTAQRRGDASRFGRKHLAGAQIEVTPAKTRNSSGVTLSLTAPPQLLEAIAAMSVTGTDTFLVNDYGKPYSVAGLGNKMREWCDAAGLPQCSAHGLRKAAARRAAENGASNQELKAVGGWTTDSQVAVYTAAVEQKRMAEQAMAPVIAFDRATREK